ncbi:rod shape-determining protein MreB [Burkholderia thailandensis]|uniref:Rod shape-determining protein MreB n=1 Tax=Burkholderia thailandensis TaxID=57975 RepID=A0AAW9D4A7_BURTH|nr:rod shape-determining protein MreB [Burkholderia thailandensis]MCS3394501.1 rod shape-determining protein MreB [Burkholderia thailandensis]MCS6427608.1 rod shape-determining protein MreB [Burkholderia thailandensis]MCS6455076.1 rod shape-determining protein MreB [Burkholderia thailandensis]MCS6466773.1 rod shape-determining protein MreB [Burkholderia thailandensis]MCS6484430.1 rod shape-determining protein MreB [Burkholderia thailandensis]
MSRSRQPSLSAVSRRARTQGFPDYCPRAPIGMIYPAPSCLYNFSSASAGPHRPADDTNHSETR